MNSMPQKCDPDPRPPFAIVTPFFLLLICAIGGTFLGIKSIKPFAQLIDMLVSMAGAGLGVWKSLRGERFQTWTPAASVRQVELR